MSLMIEGMHVPPNCPHCFAVAVGFKNSKEDSCALYCRAVTGFDGCETIIAGKPYAEIKDYDHRPEWCPLKNIGHPLGESIDRKKLLMALSDLQSQNAGHLDESERQNMEWYYFGLEAAINIVLAMSVNDVMPRTDEAAIAHLRNSGWLKEHDQRVMYSVEDAEKALEGMKNDE